MVWLTGLLGERPKELAEAPDARYGSDKRGMVGFMRVGCERANGALAAAADLPIWSAWTVARLAALSR